MSTVSFVTSLMNPIQLLQNVLQKAIFLDGCFDHIAIFIASFQVVPLVIHHRQCISIQGPPWPTPVSVPPPPHIHSPHWLPPSVLITLAFSILLLFCFWQPSFLFSLPTHHCWKDFFTNSHKDLFSNAYHLFTLAPRTDSMWSYIRKFWFLCTVQSVDVRILFLTILGQYVLWGMECLPPLPTFTAFLTQSSHVPR